MCGIAGKVWLDRAPDPSVLRGMLESMRHRGPDDAGMLVRSIGDRCFGLVSTRLSILDLSPAGHMPMSNEAGDTWIVYNGEIYNHLALRDQLSSRYGIRFRSRSDTETLLLAYQEYGLDCLPMLNGMFAFAILDLRQRRLVLARDRMGIKPLYYHRRGRELAFASELKTLMKAGGIDRQLSPEALELYLALGFVPSPYSMMKDVKKLQPGHQLILDDDGLRAGPYWSPAPRFEDDSRAGERDLAEQTRCAVSGAVRRQLMSDVPIGVLLSGGLDSTIVAAAASEAHGGPLHTFSIGFRTKRSALEEMYNWDREFARQIAHELGTIHHEVELDDGDDLITKLETRIAALDEPLWEASYLSISLMAELARENGVKVLLTGDGSDELFGGYPWYPAAQRMEFYERILFLGQAAGAFQAVLPGGEFKVKLGDFARKSRKPAHLKYLLNQSHIPQEIGRAILGLSTQDARDTAADFLADLFRPVSGLGLADQFAYADQMLWVREHFNQRIDRMMMRASIEGRVPFQDNEVLALASSIPFDIKARRGVAKSVLRDAFRSSIPGAVTNRPKRPFAAPGKAWLEGALRQYALEALSERTGREIEVLDMAAVQAFAHPLLERGFSNGNHAAGTIPLWNLLALVMWLRQRPI